MPRVAHDARPWHRCKTLPNSSQSLQVRLRKIQMVGNRRIRNTRYSWRLEHRCDALWHYPAHRRLDAACRTAYGTAVGPHGRIKTAVAAPALPEAPVDLGEPSGRLHRHNTISTKRQRCPFAAEVPARRQDRTKKEETGLIDSSRAETFALRTDRIRLAVPWPEKSAHYSDRPLAKLEAGGDNRVIVVMQEHPYASR